MRGAALCPGRQEHPGPSLHRRQRHHFQDSASLQGGDGSDFHQRDVHYVVTEYGIAYLARQEYQGTALWILSLWPIPSFGAWLIDEARKLMLIYKDQAFVPGVNGVYPVALETLQDNQERRYVFSSGR